MGIPGNSPFLGRKFTILGKDSWRNFGHFPDMGGIDHHFSGGIDKMF
jgi:hypothetical protein